MTRTPFSVVAALLLVSLLGTTGCDLHRSVNFAPESGDLGVVIHDLRAVVPEVAGDEEPRVFEKDADARTLDQEYHDVFSPEYRWVNVLLESGHHIRFVSFDDGQTWVPITLSRQDLLRAIPDGLSVLMAGMFLRPPCETRAGE